MAGQMSGWLGRAEPRGGSEKTGQPCRGPPWPCASWGWKCRAGCSKGRGRLPGCCNAACRLGRCVKDCEYGKYSTRRKVKRENVQWAETQGSRVGSIYAGCTNALPSMLGCARPLARQRAATRFGRADTKFCAHKGKRRLGNGIQRRWGFGRGHLPYSLVRRVCLVTILWDGKIA